MRKNKIICLECEVEIIRDSNTSYKRHNERKYCSQDCFNTARKLKRRCRHCKKVFRVAPHIVKRGIGYYCSYTCSNRGRHADLKTRHTCDGCGSRFTRKPSRNRGKKKYCNRSCYLKHK